MDNQTFKRLYHIQNNLTEKDFSVIFGQASAHLWDKFTGKCNYNLIDFFNHLDDTNKSLFIKYFNQNQKP